MPWHPGRCGHHSTPRTARPARSRSSDPRHPWAVRPSRKRSRPLSCSWRHRRRPATSRARSFRSSAATETADPVTPLLGGVADSVRLVFQGVSLLLCSLAHGLCAVLFRLLRGRILAVELRIELVGVFLDGVSLLFAFGADGIRLVLKR